ncbi:oligosaccharide flippase family protein [Schleiferiaceae bacterium]|nr:oligosaccharide flippase family protein [Schleiferiaceae bacterium]
MYAPIRTTVDWKGPLLAEVDLKKEKKILLGTTFILMIIVSVLLFLVSILFFKYFLDIENKLIFYSAFLSVLIVQKGFRSYFEMIFRNEKWYEIIYKMRLFFDILMPIAQFILVLIYGWTGLLGAIVLISTLYLGTLSVIGFRKVDFTLKINGQNFVLFKENIRHVCTRGGAFLISGIAVVLLFTLDQVIIGSYFGLNELGLYSFAVFFMDKSLLIGAPLIMIFRPHFFEWYNKAQKDKVKRSYEKLNSYLFKSLFPIVLIQGVFICALPVLIRMFYADYVPVLSSLLVLSIVPIFRFSPEIINMLLVAHKEFNKMIHITFTALVSEAIIYFIVIYYFKSIVSLSIAVLGASILYYIIYLLWVIKEQKRSFYAEHNSKLALYILYLLSLVIINILEAELVIILVVYLMSTLLLIKYILKNVFHLRNITSIVNELRSRS